MTLRLKETLYIDTNPFQALASAEKILSEPNFGSWSKTTLALGTHTLIKVIGVATLTPVIIW